MLFGEKNKKSNHQSFVFHEIINIFMKKRKLWNEEGKKRKLILRVNLIKYIRKVDVLVFFSILFV